MLVAENGNEVYSNEELLELAGEVNVKTDNIGTIGSLMYYKADKGGYTLVAFLDNSLNQKSMSALLKYTLYGGILAIVVFFFLSVYLARMRTLLRMFMVMDKNLIIWFWIKRIRSVSLYNGV